MPRRPTRGRSTRPTRREIKQRANATASTDDEYADVRDGLTVCEVLSYEITVVDETDTHDIVRIEETGELRRIRSSGANDLAALLTD